ncbi:adenylyltransferase/cytidyltransferase family protein [Metapseudomonas otitidis]|uniref:adenylyltransferase/cytidyltransferase family protein n=1 Tax=Metapseudomonas otitidis TaxID=319939 RepID=UPI0008E8255C|nr:nicotinate-nucleotide adenylyltransferase [Pseudomonas otitidis]
MSSHPHSNPSASLAAYAAGSQRAGTLRFRLAVYGGAFDPPHPGHETVVRRALAVADRVLLVPSHRHAHGKRMVDFALRCAWLERLAQRIDPQRVLCEPIEARLSPGQGAVYSYDLMHALAEAHGVVPEAMALVIGEDNLEHLPGFHRGAELRRDFGLLVAKETRVLHSSAIRLHLREGRPLPAAWCLPEVAGDLVVYRTPLET